MPRFLIDLVNQFKGVWARLDVAQRWLMASVLTLTLVGLDPAVAPELPETGSR